MLKQLLPFTLIASLALPFLTKADEGAATNVEQPAVLQGLAKEQTNFMKLVDAAVAIEIFKSEESTPEIKAFLTAVKEELQKIGITVQKPSFLLILQSRKLDSNTIKQLEEQYITDDMLVLLKKNRSGKSSLENGLNLIVLLAAASAKAKTK